MIETTADPAAIFSIMAGGFFCALLLGGMVLFAGVFARAAFAHLPEATAVAFMRHAFASYYTAMAVMAGLGAAALAWARPTDAIVLAAVCGGFVMARQWLMPAAHRLQEEKEAGVPGAAERFASVQGRSVLLNFVQILAAAIVLGRLLFLAAAA